MLIGALIKSRFILLCGLLSFFSSLAAASVVPGDFESLVKQVRSALTKYDLDSARTLLRQACQMDASAWDPAIDVDSARIAICETEMGVIEEAARHEDAAETHYRRALAIWTRLGPGFGDCHATTLMNLGSLYRTQRKFTEAEKMLSEALTFSRELGPGENEQRVLATVTTRLGSLYSDTGALERSRRLLTQAIGIFRGLAPGSPAELAFAYSSLGMLDVRVGNYKAAESSLREAVTLAENNLGEDHPDTAVYESDLGLALYLEGAYDPAEVILRRARYVTEARLPGSVENGAVLATLAAVETSVGKLAEAEVDSERALGIMSLKRDPESLEVAFAKVALGTVWVRERKFAEASRILSEAIAVERRSADDPRMRDRSVLAYAICMLAEVRAAQRNWSEAQALYTEAIAIYEAKLGAGHPAIAPVLRQYADVLKRSGAPKQEVKRVEARANAIKT